jgi:hypothetical protein
MRRRLDDSGSKPRRRASRSKSHFAAKSSPDPTNFEREKSAFIARKAEGDVQRFDTTAARKRRRSLSSDEAWLRSRADYVLVAAVLLIVGWELVPNSRLSAAVIIALLALAGTGFRAIAAIRVAATSRKSRS